MRIFDYIYYRIYKFYEGFNESGPWAFGIPAMAMSQYFIFLIVDRILFLLGYTASHFMEGNQEYIVMIVIFMFNFIRYFWLIPYHKLDEKWNIESRDQKLWRGVLTVFYLIGSLVGMLYVTGFFNRGSL